MFVLRQVTARLTAGLVQALGDVVTYPFRWIDVPRRMVLKLVGDGRMESDYVVLIPSATKTITLPNGYTAGVTLANGGKRLRCSFRSNDVVRLVIVSPDQGTSTILVKGTNGTTNGNHDGYLVFTGTITSISIQAPATNAADVEVEYMLYELPDLTTSAAYRDGTLAFGSYP